MGKRETGGAIIFSRASCIITYRHKVTTHNMLAVVTWFLKTYHLFPHEFTVIFQTTCETIDPFPSCSISVPLQCNVREQVSCTFMENDVSKCHLGILSCFKISFLIIQKIYFRNFWKILLFKVALVASPCCVVDMISFHKK